MEQKEQEQEKGVRETRGGVKWRQRVVGGGGTGGGGAYAIFANVRSSVTLESILFFQFYLLDQSIALNDSLDDVHFHCKPEKGERFK